MSRKGEVRVRKLADRFIRWGRKHPHQAERIGVLVRRLVDWIDRRVG